VTPGPGPTPTPVPSLTPAPPSLVHYDFALNGSTSIKAANGTAPLTGAIKAIYNLGTKAFSADLTLNNTTGQFSIFGFLPVTAGIGFKQTGQTTGTLDGGVLTTDSKMYVTFSSFNVFGFFPIGGGADCATSTPITVQLKSTSPFFNPLQGGPIAGTYTLPALNNSCGPLGWLISGFSAGAGNTLGATLTPAA